MAKRLRVCSFVVGMFLLVPMLLSACGPTASTGNNNGPKSGGTVTDLLYEEPDNLLPWQTGLTYGVMIMQALWAPLWYGDPQGNLHAGIATEIPTPSNNGVTSDFKTWTVHLKSGLKWSDGSPLTADDAVYSFNLYANPAYANVGGFPLTQDNTPSNVHCMPCAVKVDATTFTVTFDKAYPRFVEFTADGASSIIPQAVYSKYQPANILKSQDNFKPSVDSGPFVVSARQQGTSIILKRNPNYYQAGKPYLDQLTVNIVTDPSTILASLQSDVPAGGADVSWFLDFTKLQEYKAIQNFNVSQDSNPAGYEALYFNLQNPILADATVRKAMVESFDPNTVTQDVFKGSAVRTCDDQSGTWAHEPNLTCYTQNVQDAQNILTQDGWTMGSDGYRHKNGRTFELRYTTTNKATRKQTQALAQDQWKRNIGLKIDIINQPANTFFGQPTGTLFTGNFDIGEFFETFGYDPDDSTLWQSTKTPANGGANYTHYSNPTVDQAEIDQQKSFSQAQRKQDFHVVHQQLLQDNPAMFLFSSPNIFGWSSKVHNYNPSPLSAVDMWNVWDWYVS